MLIVLTDQIIYWRLTMMKIQDQTVVSESSSEASRNRSIQL